jgi:glyceraldehyde 3-phosphate dehydrogenase
MNIVAGINGFGRFGLHLLKYWLDRSQESGFSIAYINDDQLPIQTAYDIITTDRHVVFSKYKVRIYADNLVFFEPNGAKHSIRYSNCDKQEIPWLGVPDVVCECSGKNTSRTDCECYLFNLTKLVVISATSWDADKILVYGFNHAKFDYSLHRVISYGSCTVNAYVPLANFIHNVYEVIDSDFNVIHNVQNYRLKDANSLNRKFCTAEKVAPQLLDFLSSENFCVNYTVVPYTGVSMLDIRFRVKEKLDRTMLIGALEDAVYQGGLKHLYSMDEVDIGPKVYNCTTYSAVLIKENIRILQDNIYLHGYFDNENSVNRFYDLLHYISSCEPFALAANKMRVPVSLAESSTEPLGLEVNVLDGR